VRLTFNLEQDRRKLEPTITSFQPSETQDNARALHPSDADNDDGDFIVGKEQEKTLGGKRGRSESGSNPKRLDLVRHGVDLPKHGQAPVY
jgi:hypothetical protein